MNYLKEIKSSLLHLLFPHVCAGCGATLQHNDSEICFRCMAHLPYTHFEKIAANPVEKKFWGRINLTAATAQFYFTHRSLIQQLLHQFKYKNNKKLGQQLGRLMGASLLQNSRFMPDALVPLPLFPGKERKRGFNQAAILCHGMAEEMKIPVIADALTRIKHTDSQTKKGRIERWQNVEGKFMVSNPEKLQHKHLLLVDDVVTTGATLEACGISLLALENVSLSIATLCLAGR